MLSVLIEGTLIAAPVRRTGAKGSAFVTAQVRCHADDGESVLCSVIAFQAAVAEALAALGAGDAVAVTGPAGLSRWEKDGEPRAGLKVTATRVLGVQEASQRRRTAAGREPEPRREERPPAVAPAPWRGRPAGRPAAPALPKNPADWDSDELL